ADDRMSLTMMCLVSKVACTDKVFQQEFIRFKPYPATTGISWQRRPLALFVRHVTSQITKLFGVHLGGSGRFIGQIDPIVYAKKRVIEIVLGIGNGKTGQKGVAYIHLAISIKIFQIQ